MILSMCAIFKASAEFDIGILILIICLVVFIGMEYDWKMHSLYEEKNECIQHASTNEIK